MRIFLFTLLGLVFIQIGICVEPCADGNDRIAKLEDNVKVKAKKERSMSKFSFNFNDFYVLYEMPFLHLGYKILISNFSQIVLFRR